MLCYVVVFVFVFVDVVEDYKACYVLSVILGALEGANCYNSIRSMVHKVFVNEWLHRL